MMITMYPSRVFLQWKQSPCDGDPCMKGGNCVPDFKLNTYQSADHKQGFNETVNYELGMQRLIAFFFG